MVRLIAEVAFGYSITSASPVWTDITQYVDMLAGVSIERGAQDELSETQPGTASLVLDNADGRFTSDRTTSPYYPNVKKNVPIRLRVVTADRNLITNPSFESGLADWSKSATPTIDPSTARAKVGTQSMLLTFGGVGVSGQTAHTTVYGLDIGATYTASAWVWVPAGGTHVHLRVGGVADGAASTLTDTWQRIQVTFTATAPQHVIGVRSFTTPTAGHQVWIDGVQVEEGSMPSAETLVDGAQIHPRYVGMVNSWPVKWQGLQSKVTVTCTDVFKWSDLERELLPMLSQEVLLDRPTAYYPLTEASDAASAGDLSGTAGVGTLAVTQAGTGGTLDFAAGTGPNSCPAPVFTPSSTSAGKYLSADLGQSMVDANVNFRARIEAWFSTSTNGRVLLALASTDASTRVVVLLESGTGKLALEKDQGGNGTQTYVFPTPNLADGKLHHLVYNEFTNDLVIDGTTYNLFAYNGTDMRMLTVGGYAGTRLWSGTISHVAVYCRSITATELAGHYTTGTTAHVGESASARMARIASYVGLSVTTQGSTFDPMASQAQLGQSALTHMREIETTESGKLLASRASVGLVFQSRGLRYNPTPAVTLAFADLETDDLDLLDDDQKMVNTVVASRPEGATQRIVNQAAVDTYGPKPRNLTLLKTSDNSVADASNWLVSRYADPPPEIRQVPVQAYSLPLTTYRALLDADVSTVIGLTSLPDQAPAPTATLVVEGYSERISAGQHLLDFHTSRAQTDSVWFLDDPTYSVLGSTTRLAY
ncbi:carbohydrate binding domain-containing protein [Streptomyces sp. JB150]|uniref:phage head spike fiber domain-containing protein n=1 Tax=Streptomyces sp. JB150 TaxID=2714844 RepID=UPI00140D3880|nr:carbohydrate binding domain-containing protein [Streptomyces sp. JB150]QIJ62546.1 hypothetical protein G7Z13_11230 [Streptomyces sp. JB150]